MIFDPHWEIHPGCRQIRLQGQFQLQRGSSGLSVLLKDTSEGCILADESVLPSFPRCCPAASRLLRRCLFPLEFELTQSQAASLLLLLLLRPQTFVEKNSMKNSGLVNLVYAKSHAYTSIILQCMLAKCIFFYKTQRLKKGLN